MGPANFAQTQTTQPVRWFVWFFLVIPLAITHSKQSLALSIDVEPLREITLTLKKDLSFETPGKQLTLSMRRIPRPGAEAVIITHATVLTNHNMRDMGHMLWEAGYDVWLPNLRGHGNGQERSFVKPYTHKDYSFDKMVTQDLEIIVDHVRQTHPPKIHVIGFSIGGMVWEQYLGGVTQRNGRMKRSRKLAKKRCQEISSYIAFLTPPDVKGISPSIETLLYPLLTLFENHGFFIPFNRDYGQRNQRDSSLPGTLRRVALQIILPSFRALLPHGVLESKNIDRYDDEFERLALNISSAHTDYVSDLIRWFKSPYQSRDGRVDYTNRSFVDLPMLQIGATKDGLARHDLVRRRARHFPNQDTTHVALAHGFAHIDLNFRKGLSLVGPVMIDFLKNPQSLGPTSETIHLGR